MSEKKLTHTYMWKTFSHKKWEKMGNSGDKCLLLDCYLTTIEIYVSASGGIPL